MSDHDKYRSKVCVVCLQKTARDRPLSARDIELILRFARENYDIFDSDYPSGLCGGCTLKLYKKEKEPNTILNVAPFIPDRGIQLRSTVCECQICLVAKANLFTAKKMKKKAGRPNKNNTSSLPPSLPLSSTIPSSSSVRLPFSTPSPSTITICRVCCAEIYQGCRHVCLSNRSSRKRKIDNLATLISSPETSKKLAERIVPKGGKKNLFGISTENLSTIGKNMNLSLRRTKELSHYLRASTNSRKAVAPHVEKQLYKDRHLLDQFFDYDMLLFMEEESKAKKKPERKFRQHAVYTNNINGLIDKVIDHRSLNRADTFIRIGLDGGGGFVKICVSVFDAKSKESRKSSLSKKYLDSGVKKVQMLAVAPDVPENYLNMKRLWVEAGIHKLQYRFIVATDMKLMNILLGLQNHSCTHPCCWCNIDKNNLDKKGKLRTFSSLIDLFYDFKDANVSKDDAAKYGNVIHLPVIEALDKDRLVFEIVPPPELHLLLGPTNKMYSSLEHLWPALEAWLQSIHVKKTDYHGGQFEGNDCKKILNKMDSLEERIPNEFLPFITAFRSFNEVREACYGSKLALDYLDKINKFRIDYLKLGISVTPKVHAVFFHIEDFCEYSGMALGDFSEQTAESLHKEFEKCWENFYVKDFDNPKYPERFLSAVKVFNSLHL